MIAYFGYGSLVNRDTRPVQETANTARLSGWERHWAHRVDDDGTYRRCTSLSARPAQDKNAWIDGVVVLIESADLPALDERESGYFRQSVPLDFVQLDVDLPVDEVVVYQSHEAHFKAANERYPILQSYVDCVMAGYHRLYGQAGLDAFMRTTFGWQGCIIDDRERPVYPRAIDLPTQQREHFDSMIEQYR
jgi:hypothetical protein